MNEKPLPRFQRAVFDYIVAGIARTGRSPTYTDMAAHFGCASTEGITSPVIQLEKKGYLARGRKHYAITVLRMPEEQDGSALHWLKRRVANEAKAATAA